MPANNKRDAVLFNQERKLFYNLSRSFIVQVILTLQFKVAAEV